MQQGYLADYFDGIAAKRLSAVESDPKRSNQHEFAAIKDIFKFMDRSAEATKVPARFIYLSDDEPEPIVENADLTLYDVRRLQPHRSSEYRFYFKTNAVTKSMSPGDLFIVAKLRAGGLLLVVAKDGSTVGSQLEWLFGLDSNVLFQLAQRRNDRGKFVFRGDLGYPSDKLEITSAMILESIGVEVEIHDESALDKILAKFGESWPETKRFSPFARLLTDGVDARDDPDGALVAWVNREYVLYRTLERHLISERLTKGFAGDTGVDDFLQYSLSVQNRRKSRSGTSLENHIEEILKSNELPYSRGAKTEMNSKPDFLFPGIAQYQDSKYPGAQLHMLASKRSVKDRWRQILAEAERIPIKHLLTLELAISEPQTDEMARQNVQLVIPQPLHYSFTEAQRANLLNLREFVDIVKPS